MSSSNEFYTFQFNATQTGVTRLTEVEGRKSQTENIGNSRFDLKTDAGAVVEVTRTELSRKGFLETTVYRDADKNGQFNESFAFEVATSQVALRNLEQYQFDLGANGTVTAQYELQRGQWKLDRLDRDETLQQVSLNGKNYVLKTEQEGAGVEFTLYRDDNKDGIWTEIAEGESNSLSVDLVGIQGYLAAADALIG
ncbi:MAG: hypothetical protein PHI55_00925 [Burkholderiaceae bacterium]|nr:hypothetical protein [Burkholderiaceae bacterium]